MNNEEGFTLIEVLIAMAVLAIGILTMQVMQGVSVDENALSSSISNKSNYAATQIEHIIRLDYNSTLLDDVDGDGTNQDGDIDGIDDQDDGDPNTLGINEDFGLRHWECWRDTNGNLVDAYGTAVPGCTRIADHAAAFEDYAIYWNVAVDHPTENNKTINIIVVSPRDQYNANRMPLMRAEYTYVKDDLI